MNNVYNPDVLLCLANLSNDEVFTPPELANDVLDLLPASLWRNKDAKFLDPVSKSGVFLREIVKRLDRGLESQIPNKQRRIDHILSNQVYGIAITELTALISRRSVYCSKYANGDYSISTAFQDISGNIIYERKKHTWKHGKCTFCGASKEVYDRGEDLEQYAYDFIHRQNPEKIFNMKFDVIIGNPPYQLNDGGAQKSASPLYHKFVEQSIKLCPRHLLMIIPARWYSGGKGLDDFRKLMLNEHRLKEIHDFPDTSDCFPGINIRGGICYFHWQYDFNGDCTISNYKNGVEISRMNRPLLEEGMDVFIRYNEAISILRKVKSLNEESFSELVSAHKAFGLRTFVKGEKVSFENSIKLYQNGGIGFVKRDVIVKNEHLIDKWKVIVPYSSPGDDSYPHLILSKPLVSEPNSCCTETYLVVGPFDDELSARNVVKYMCSSFVRFLILLLKPSQHVTQKTYQLVPKQDFKNSWSDAELFEKYNLNKSEIELIASLIKPINI